uniref:tumor necrosis factor receptor superfamily member 9-like n=1 Tax=Pristiophorus japonicus TaxID=55135 RepID=UPI00398F3203
MELLHVLAVLVLLVLQTSGAGIPCSAGWFQSPTGQCTPCPAGSFTESTNSRPTCTRCQQCLIGKFVIEQPCMASSNTKCQCAEGYMCRGKDCKACIAHKVCKKGQEVQHKGDSKRDTVCRDCRNGTYSDTPGRACKPWTDCSAKGLQVVRSGSRTEDVLCGAPLTTPMVLTNSGRPTNRTPKQTDNPRIKDEKKRNEGIAGIIAIILLPCVFLPFTLYIAVQSKKKQKHFPLDVMNQEDLPVALVMAADDRCSCHCPEEEMGDWQLRQETTAKPPV